MEHARAPAELVLEGGPANRADAWRRWLKQFNIFLKASGVHQKSKAVQASLLINLIGSNGYDIYSTFKFSKAESDDDLDLIISKFNEYFGTKQNTTMARFRFFMRNQDVGENIDTYVTALRLLSKPCEFEHLEDGLIRDRIMCGITDTAVRDRLLRSEELTLDKTIRICQANELSIEENRQIESAKSMDCSRGSAVDALFGARAPVRGDGGGGGGRAGLARSGTFNVRTGGRSGTKTPGPRFASQNEESSISCGACGMVHSDDSRCPARNVKCFLCYNTGHFKRMCPKKGRKHVYEVQEDHDELLQIASLDSKIVQHTDSKWYESLILSRNGMNIIFKLDTGSDLNVIPLNTFKKLGFSTKDITNCHIKARSFCGNYIPILGSCKILSSYKRQTYIIDFVISEVDCQCILGNTTCEKLGLVKRIFTVSLDNYYDLFHGIGKLPGKYKIILENNASPSICPVRKIPLGIRDKLKSELEHMEQMGVVRKVSHPTSWVNAIVLPAKKDGSIRVCLDPRPLNQAIRRAHYPLPTLCEIATKLRDARYFSKLDARSGFWMVELDEDSADLCTFGTPFGRYQFLRLPYGINCASEAFHAKIRYLLEDLEGVDSFVDDVIVWGQTKDEHDVRLKRLLDRAREVGIKFNRDKCEFCVEQVTYLGHIFSVKGMQIDNNKLRAIKNMPCPRDRATLERFLGMVNYLSKFISNYSEMASPLRCLLKKDVEWYWDATHEMAVLRLKEALCSAPVLAIYSVRLPIVITVDASGTALGAALLQAGRPVEFASLTLSDTQTRYAQIEKEMLAIVFAMERFHQYVYGRSDIVVETDHKPLEAIFKKTLNAVPARLQRMALRIQCYDFTVKYKPGKYMYLADTLSRAALPDLMHDKVSQEVEDQSCFLINNLRFSDCKLQLVKEATLNDEESKQIIDYILNGWPKYKSDVHRIVLPHWPYKDTFEFIDGVIIKDGLVFIPLALRGDMMARVHEGHLGIDRCKRRARDVMFWNGMSRDIERMVRGCAVCAEHAALPSREPMIAHSCPDIPWRKVGSDIFVFNQKCFLILVDYFSNYIEVSPLSSIGSKTVIAAMKDQFARHGIPAELVTDNGPAYMSSEFRKFCSDWCFKHTTSSPYYAQSNGLSERAVRTVKNIIKKSLSSGTDMYLGLLNFRSTPRYGVSSPAQLLMGRRLSTRLPVHVDKLQPERDNKQDYINIKRNRKSSERYYNKHAHKLAALHPGERVFVADGNVRRPMCVSAPAPQPRSYFLTDQSGRQYRRNRRHIIRTGAQVNRAPPVSFEGREDSGCDERSSLCDVEQSANDRVNDSVATDPTPAHSTPHVREAAREARRKLAMFYKK